MTINLPFSIELIFRHPPRMWLLFSLVVAVMIVSWDWMRRKKALKDPWMMLHLSSSRLHTFVGYCSWWAAWIIATGLVVVAYAYPEKIIYDWERVFERVRIAFILDVSLSTKRAEDILPNRLEAEKEVIRDFTAMLERDGELKGKYSLALVPFSGAALPYYLPFTASRDEFLAHLDAVDTDTITRKGTSLWAALRAYDELLILRPAADKNTVDLGILISDGGKEEGKKERALLPGTINDLRDQYRTVAYTLAGERIFVRAKNVQRNVVLNTVGVGKVIVDPTTGERKTIPVLLVNRDRAGNFTGYDHVDENDSKSPVLTSELDERILREIAQAGGGVYRHFSDREMVLREFKDFVIKNRIGVDRIRHLRYESARTWFLFPAFLIYYFLFGYGGWCIRLFRRTLQSVRIHTRNERISSRSA